METSYTIIRTFLGTDPYLFEKLSSWRNLDYAMKKMRLQANKDVDEFLGNSHKVSIEYVDGARCAEHKAIKIYCDDNPIYAYDVIETKYLAEYGIS